MNIFLLNLNPKIAAEHHCDKHVVKMILETAQLLYTAHWVLNPEQVPDNAYRKTHPNHPSAIWARESKLNYLWLAELGWWLCKEYQYRYGETKTHKTEAHIVWLRANPPSSIPKIPVTPFRLAMPKEYKCDDPVKSYHIYYREAKSKITIYTKRPLPDFLLKHV